MAMNNSINFLAKLSRFVRQSAQTSVKPHVAGMLAKPTPIFNNCIYSSFVAKPLAFPNCLFILIE
jgi:hypothetical protein